MNLIEAIKSGKPFKHSRMTDFISKDFDRFGVSLAMLKDDDWEIQEEKIELTAEQIRRAFEHRICQACYEECLGGAIKELGFKE